MIVVAGEALVDLVPEGENGFVAVPGGGPFNTARSLGRLGQPVAYLGRLSTDRFGRELGARLREDGVHVAPLSTVQPTTLALAELDASGSARYRFYTHGTSAAELEPAAALAALPEHVSALHVGTLGLVLEPLAEAVEALVEHVANDVLVMTDPNIRPAAIQGEKAYRERLSRMLARTDVLKVSDEDLAYLVPGAPLEVAAQALLEQGPAVVLVTRGAAGATAAGAFGVRSVPAPVVEVADTIGAGDAFSGGWLAHWNVERPALTDGEAVAAATECGCYVAALTCTRAGASPPHRSQVARVLD